MSSVKEGVRKEFPGRPVAKTLSFHCRGYRFDPCQGIRILHVVWCGVLWPKKQTSKNRKEGMRKKDAFSVEGKESNFVLKNN